LVDKYKGTFIYSAAWPEDLDLSGRNVGLIGNGSSRIQILPVIAPKVDRLKTFIREATWVSAPVNQEYRVYMEEERTRFAANPEFHRDMRTRIESVMNE
jgi:cation diffusion facilitator CzcD-associated flavoprotein CzcO